MSKTFTFKRVKNFGPYKVYQGTQSLLIIVPAGIEKTFNLTSEDYVEIVLVDDRWFVKPIRE